MLARLLPIVLAFAGLGLGAGAGVFLRPLEVTADQSAAGSTDAPEGEVGPPTSGNPDQPAETLAGTGALSEGGGDAPAHDYVKLNNQFVVPVVEEGRVSALVILSLSLEVTAGLTETVYQIEPKLRDSLLQVMFDHANSGGFKGTFTDGSNMVLLRQALLEIAQRIMGNDVSDVLIVDIVRQDS